jgi:HAD superfamily hydrolase (TIGR01509 family)
MMTPLLPNRLVSGIHQFLTAHSDVPMAVATNAESANVHFVLENSSLAPFFRVVVDGSQVTQPKPHPEVFLTAARILGHSPADCVIFEDSLTGVTAARAAGAKVVGVATTLTDLPGVDLMIRDFLDSKLEPWLRELHVSQ